MAGFWRGFSFGVFIAEIAVEDIKIIIFYCISIFEIVNAQRYKVVQFSYWGGKACYIGVLQLKYGKRSNVPDTFRQGGYFTTSYVQFFKGWQFTDTVR